MSADGVEKMAAWDKAAEEIKADVKAGKNVGFINLLFYICVLKK